MPRVGKGRQSHTAINHAELPYLLSLSLRESDYTVEFDYFLRGKESLRIDARVPEVEGLTKDQVQNIPPSMH